MVDIPSSGKFENRRRPRRYTPSSNPPPNRDGRSSSRADIPQTRSSEPSSLGSVLFCVLAGVSVLGLLWLSGFLFWVLAGLGLVLALLWPSS